MRKEMIRNFINSGEYVPMSRENLSVVLCVPKSDTDEFNRIIDELIAEGDISEGRKKRLFSTSSIGFTKGVFRSTSKDFAFVTDEEGDIFIPAESLGGALNGDSVLVKPKKAQKGAVTKREGAVVRVLHRANKTVVGTFIQERGYGILVPDDSKLPDEIFIEQRYTASALNGQKVVAEIISYDSPSSSLCAKVTEVLGFPNDFGVDVLSVIKSHGFSADFPAEVLNEKISTDFHAEISKRTDLRSKCIITIDGEDTKDIDDAVCVEKSENGYILGVHIADVSHYVHAGTPLDKEAYHRGTSVYLADRVLPMLPPVLSNGICSLNEGEERLTMSVIMEFDNSGNLISSSFHKSVIKSAARMTYENVRLILEDEDSFLCEKYASLVPMLKNMYALYLLLAKKTKERGAIDFEIPEAKALFDKDGKTVDIIKCERNFAHKMIEEFMIAANCAVASFLEKNSAPTLYRVHDKPNKEKLENTLSFIYNKGYPRSQKLGAVLSSVRATPVEAVFSAMLLRSMAKAEYKDKNDGHFGLMLDSYCHFTSPIRRYPDLICHRALKAVIENDSSQKEYLKNFVGEAAKQCTDRENDAAMCERDTLDIKKAEYMENFIGEEFSGVISSVTRFGFFVMLGNTVEGLVHIETLRDDYYIFDEETLTLCGERSGREFTVGDKVKVKLAKASKLTRKIDFSLVEGGTTNGRKPKKKASRPKQKRTSRVLHRRKVRGRH